MLHKQGCNIINSDNNRFILFFSLEILFSPRFYQFLDLDHVLDLDHSTERSHNTKFRMLFLRRTR